MKSRAIGISMALAALATAQGAAAQQACVQSEDFADTVVYGLPVVYDTVQAPCSSVFSSNAFMTNEADSFIGQFRAQQDASWPGTLRLIKVFIAANAAKDGGDAAGMADAFALMPEEALRPLVDVIIGQLIDDRIASNIKVSTCSDIAEAMELISPLPLDNIAGLTAFIAKQVELKEPAICGTKEALAEQTG